MIMLLAVCTVLCLDMESVRVVSTILKESNAINVLKSSTEMYQQHLIIPMRASVSAVTVYTFLRNNIQCLPLGVVDWKF